MNTKNVILAVAIAAILVGVIVGIQSLRGNTNAAQSDAACGYTDCDWTGNFSLKPGDTYPPTCPKCGRASVFTTSTCKKCGNKQILNELLRQLPGSDDLPQATKCEQCGGPIVHGD